MTLESFESGLTLDAKPKKWMGECTNIDSITPFKTCLYMLLVELEKIQADELTKLRNDRRSYYAFCIWSLTNRPSISLPLLKCYIYVFMDRFDGLLRRFLLAVNYYKKKELVPDNERLLFPQRMSTNFIRPLSLLGFFAKNYEAEYTSMNTTQHFQFAKRWSGYLSSSASEDEIVMFGKEWNIDVMEIMNKVAQYEANLSNAAVKDEPDKAFNPKTPEPLQSTSTD